MKFDYKISSCWCILYANDFFLYFCMLTTVIRCSDYESDKKKKSMIAFGKQETNKINTYRYIPLPWFFSPYHQSLLFFHIFSYRKNQHYFLLYHLVWIVLHVFYIQWLPGTSLFVKHQYFGRFCCWVNPWNPINAHRFLDKWRFIVKTIVQKFMYLKPLNFTESTKIDAHNIHETTVF